MNGIADINLTGEELTKEVQEGIDKAKKDGFEYRISPLDIFSKMDKLDEKMKSLDAFCDKYSALQSQVTELKSYSRVTSWNELLLAVPKAINEVTISDPVNRQQMSQWLSDYESVATEDGMRMAISDLEELLNGFPKNESELICSKVNALFNQFHDVGGEFFIIHNYKEVPPQGTLPFSKTVEIQEPQVGIEVEPTQKVENTPTPTKVEHTPIRTYSKRTQVNEVSVEGESYGNKLKRLFGGRNGR